MELMNEDNPLKILNRLAANPQSNDITNYYHHEKESGGENLLMDMDSHNIIINNKEDDYEDDIENDPEIKRKTNIVC